MDVLVVTGDYPMAFEAKAGSLTPAGRRGAPLRGSRVARDVLGRAWDQLSALREYILSGGREFADREGGEVRRRLNSEVDSPVLVAVTFERMDPLAAHAAEFAERDDEAAVWSVNLADFLMVADVLRSAPEFFAYARARSDLSRSSVKTYVESDLMALFLEDRFSELQSLADRSDRVVVGYSSTGVNAHFTRRELGLTPEPLETGLPPAIAARLSERVTEKGWGIAAVTAMGVTRPEWLRWTKFVRRRLNRRQERVRFEFADRKLVVVVTDPWEGRFSFSDDGMLELSIPVETFISGGD